MSNAPFDSSDSKPRDEVDGTSDVPDDVTPAHQKTVVRSGGEHSIDRAAGKSDTVTTESDESSLSQAGDLSSAPRIATFRSDRGIVPLTGIERLQAIMDQLKSIDTPGILELQSIEVLEDGCQVVMSPVNGTTLEKMLLSRRPSWMEALRSVLSLVEAIIPVHDAGLAHGCLNPSRIFFQNEKLTAIADFGLCLVSGDFSVSPDHTQMACVAPENTGIQRFPLTPQMDVYSIGIVLYRLIGFRYPFRSDSISELQRQIREDAPQPPRQLAPAIPSELEQLCLKCLSKNPADRPASARQLWKPLNRILAHHEKAAEQPSTDSVSLTESQRIAIRRLDSVRRVMLMQTDSPDGSILETAAATLERLGILPEAWSGDGLLFSLPHSTPNSDWTVAFADRLVRCIRAVSRRQKKRQSCSESVTVRVSSARLHSEPDRDLPFAAESLDRVVLELQATVSNGEVDVCSRGQELLTRSLHCEKSRPDSNNPDRIRFQIADRDGEIMTFHGSRNHVSLPLSGRSSQFAMLQSRWEQTREGMGQIVLLIGDEGMGKTRIVNELVSQVVADQNNPGRVIVWGCRPYQQGQSLHPLLHWLRHSHDDFDVPDGDELVSSRIESLFENAETSITEPAQVLSSELGVHDSSYRQKTSLSATQRRNQSCQVLLDWLTGQAKDSALLFVIEDLQWVDPATLSFLTRLIESGFNDRIMTLLTFRPEFETPWGSRAHQTQVALNRLTKRHARSMIEAALERSDVSDSSVDEILRRTDGIPLYIEAYVAGRIKEQFSDS